MVDACLRSRLSIVKYEEILTVIPPRNSGHSEMVLMYEHWSAAQGWRVQAQVGATHRQGLHRDTNLKKQGAGCSPDVEEHQPVAEI